MRVNTFEYMNTFEVSVLFRSDRPYATLTFIMSARQMIRSGSVVKVRLSVDAVQVLPPGVGAQRF